MEMNELRSRIDAIDSQMVDLYKQRMDAVSEIGETQARQQAAHL